MSNSEMIDGISLDTWKEIEIIASQYPKPIKFADSVSSKHALINFYLNSITPNSKPAYQTMDKGRMATICFRIYNAKETDGCREASVNLLKKLGF